jgi:hypothetical protein
MKKKHIKKYKTNLFIKFMGKKQVINTCRVHKKENPSLFESLSKLIDDINTEELVFTHDTKPLTQFRITQFLKPFGDITSKDFRTWKVNSLAIELLPDPRDLTKFKRRIAMSNVIKNHIAPKLNHTAAICKKSYLLPIIYNLYVDRPMEYINIVKGNTDITKILTKILSI